MIEWIIGIGVAGYVLDAFQKNKQREKEEEEERAKALQAAEEARRNAELKETIRRNTICEFEDGISQDDFERIVRRTCKKIKRVSSVNINGPVIKGTVRTSSGISEWGFTIDFNDYGHITGKYWLSSENDDSSIPEIIADNICELLNNPDRIFSSSINRDNEQVFTKDIPKILFCPFCGSQLDKDSARFCPNCGEKLPVQETSQKKNTSNAKGNTMNNDPIENAESITHMLPIPGKISCKQCGSSIRIDTYRKFICCPYCGGQQAFPGFQYKNIDPSSSEFAAVKKWMDCPSCRGQNMYLGASGLRWRCPDCGFSITQLKKMTTVFWFCDCCETFLNVQPGFTTKKKIWKCTECGFENDVSPENVD